MLIYMLGFPKTVRLNIIMFMLSSILFVTLFLIAQSNLTYYFAPYISTSHRNNTHVIQKVFFATGARIKQPVYVCIGQRFGWEIYFPLMSDLNRFQPSPFMGARVAPQHTGE